MNRPARRLSTWPKAWPLYVLAISLLTAPVWAQDVSQSADRNEVESVNGPDGSDAVSASIAEDGALEAYIDGLIATWQAVHGAPGYAVAVVRPNHTVLTKGYGLADIATNTKVDPSATRFYIASISKTFVWTSIMMLVERGDLALDTDVNAYLERYTVPEGQRPLTLADLMDHRAGLEENLELFSPSVAAMDLPRAIATTQPQQVFPRGERAAYSNWGSNLAALIIEDATGTSYAQFLMDEILRPLGMDTTTLTDQSPAATSPDAPLSKNYRMGKRGAKELPQLDLGSFAPIGGMATTATDMARWLRFHLNRGELDGVRLLTEESYAEMRRRQFDPVPGSAGRAHGFFDLPYRSTNYYGHTGSINAFFSKFSVAPELGLGVFIAQNTSDRFDPLSFVPRLIFDRELTLRGEFDPSAARPLPSEADIAEAQSLAGSYITSRRVFHGPQKIFAALDGIAELSAADGYLIGGRDHAPFVRIAPDIWENRHGERLAIIRDSNGNMERFISSGGATEYEPVTLLTNPRVLALALGATVLFSLTTWLGLWRRFRQQFENRVVGRVLNWIALLATLPMFWLAFLGAKFASMEKLSFAEVFADWPMPFLQDLSLAATVTTGVAALMVVSLFPAWAFSGWNSLRKVHFSLYALAYAVLGLSFMNWGLAPHLP